MTTPTRLIAAVVLVLCACTGPRAYTRGTYEDPNVIEMLSDKFNENDLQLIAKKMADSVLSPLFFDKMILRWPIYC